MADDFNGQYDKPLFGAGGNWASTGISGTPQTPVPDIPGTTETTAWVTPQGSGWQNGDAVPVSPDSVNLPSQTDSYGGSDPNLVPGIPGSAFGSTGIGHGHTHYGTGAS